MAISFVNKADAEFSSLTASPVANLPSSLQSGDLLLAVAATDTNHNSSAPSGWTRVGEVDVSTDTTTTVIYRFATGSEGSTETLTSLFSTTEIGTVSVAAYRGVDPDCPVAAAAWLADTSSNTTWSTPSIDYFPEPDCALVLFGGMDPGAVPRTASAPTDFTERTDYSAATAIGWTWIGDYIGPPAETDYVVANSTLGGADTIGSIIVLLLPKVGGVQRRYAGTVADDATAGSTSWLSPADAQGSPTHDAASATGTGESHYLKATNFGFAIPTGAQINGVKAYVSVSENATGTVTDTKARIVKADGTIGSTDKSSGRNWVNSSTLGTFFDCIPHGGATDLWGETITEATVEDTDFGFAFTATTGASGPLYCQCFVLSVYYGLAPPPASHLSKMRHLIGR